MTYTASRLRLCGAVGALATCVALGGCAGTATAQATPQRHTAAPTQTQPTRQTQPGAHLVVVGDSLAVGVDQERPEPAWPLQLARALGDRRPSVYGMPGFTAGQLDVALDASGIRDGAASVLVVEAGTNDFWHLTPLAQFRADYPRLLDDTTASDGGGATGAPRLVCLGVWTDEGHTNDLGATVAQYDAIIRRACEARGGVYVPLSGLFGDPANISPTDHFHPSSAGQQAIADLIEPYAER